MKKIKLLYINNCFFKKIKNILNFKIFIFLNYKKYFLKYKINLIKFPILKLGDKLLYLNLKAIIIIYKIFL
ncbi:hypothetical protein ACT2CR_00055 [Candidatus Vidania fulgoroideorum]